MEEVNKFLTEAMGECFHREVAAGTMGHYECAYCDDPFYYDYEQDFFTWEGFGKLWEWAIKQEWWRDCMYTYFDLSNNPLLNGAMQEIINPETFAKAIYEFLNKGE